MWVAEVAKKKRMIERGEATHLDLDLELLHFLSFAHVGGARCVCV